MSNVHTRLLLAEIDVPVRVVSIKRGIVIRGHVIKRPRVTLDLAGEHVTLSENDEALVHATGKFERNAGNGA